MLTPVPYLAGTFDIAVIGAGHAGVEAALAAARLGCSVVLFTISLDAIANMPCNPSIAPPSTPFGSSRTGWPTTGI